MRFGLVLSVTNLAFGSAFQTVVRLVEVDSPTSLVESAFVFREAPVVASLIKGDWIQFTLEDQGAKLEAEGLVMSDFTPGILRRLNMPSSSMLGVLLEFELENPYRATDQIVAMMQKLNVSDLPYQLFVRLMQSYGATEEVMKRFAAKHGL